MVKYVPMQRDAVDIYNRCCFRWNDVCDGEEDIASLRICSCHADRFRMETSSIITLI